MKLKKTNKELEMLNHLQIIITVKEYIIHQYLKIGNDLKEIIQQLLLTFYMLKKLEYVLLIFQKLCQIA